MTSIRNRRKTQMIQAAVDLVKEGGLQNLTTKNIAACVGVAESSIYNIFESKQILIQETLLWLRNTTSNQAVRLWEQNINTWQNITEAITATANLLVNNPYRFAEEALAYEQLLIGDANTAELLERTFRDSLEEFEGLLTQLTVRLNVNLEAFPFAMYELVMLVVGHIMFSLLFSSNPESRAEQDARFLVILDRWTHHLQEVSNG